MPPVMPGYAHADTPHEKTVQREGYRYGCHGTQRGGEHSYLAHPWRYAGPAVIKTDWLPKPCGHSERETDAACEGCINRGDHFFCQKSP